MKSIYTLKADLYEQLSKKGWFDESISSSFESEVGSRLRTAFNESSERGRLRLSNMGPKCPRALWYSIHEPGAAEPLPPWAIFKYTYGHIIEALAVSLAKASGHTVEGEQDEVVLDGVTGHIDALVDGCVVDFKSTSTLSFEKFERGTLAENDDFGYLDQLDGYVTALHDDPRLLVKDRGFICAIDKQLGHVAIYEHTVREDSIRKRIKHYREIVERPYPPPCECRTEPDGGSGNVKLDWRAGYNPYKYSCFPGLRTFLYAGGPRYLTKVVKIPMNKNGPIKEVDRYGNMVYN